MKKTFGPRRGEPVRLERAIASVVRTYCVRAMTPITEITVAGGGQYRVQGDASDVERLILNAARGSIMELAWMTDAKTGERLGVNPSSVVSLRAIES